ncbi:unnamed protein product [Closterium sp. NIES-54]
MAPDLLPLATPSPHPLSSPLPYTHPSCAPHSPHSPHFMPPQLTLDDPTCSCSCSCFLRHAPPAASLPTHKQQKQQQHQQQQQQHAQCNQRQEPHMLPTAAGNTCSLPLPLYPHASPFSSPHPKQHVRTRKRAHAQAGRRDDHSRTDYAVAAEAAGTDAVGSGACDMWIALETWVVGQPTTCACPCHCTSLCGSSSSCSSSSNSSACHGCCSRLAEASAPPFHMLLADYPPRPPLLAASMTAHAKAHSTPSRASDAPRNRRHAFRSAAAAPPASALEAVGTSLAATTATPAAPATAPTAAAETAASTAAAATETATETAATAAAGTYAALLRTRFPHTHNNPLSAKPTAPVKRFRLASLSSSRVAGRLYSHNSSGSSSGGESAGNTSLHTSPLYHFSAAAEPSTHASPTAAFRPPFATAAAGAPLSWPRAHGRPLRSLPLTAAAPALPARLAGGRALGAFESGASHSVQRGLGGHYARWTWEEGANEREHERQNYFREMERRSREWEEVARRGREGGGEGGRQEGGEGMEWVMGAGRHEEEEKGREEIKAEERKRDEGEEGGTCTKEAAEAAAATAEEEEEEGDALGEHETETAAEQAEKGRGGAVGWVWEGGLEAEAGAGDVSRESVRGLGGVLVEMREAETDLGGQEERPLGSPVALRLLQVHREQREEEEEGAGQRAEEGAVGGRGVAVSGNEGTQIGGGEWARGEEQGGCGGTRSEKGLAGGLVRDRREETGVRVEEILLLKRREEREERWEVEGQGREDVARKNRGYSEGWLGKAAALGQGMVAALGGWGETAMEATQERSGTAVDGGRERGKRARGEGQRGDEKVAKAQTRRGGAGVREMGMGTHGSMLAGGRVEMGSEGEQEHARRSIHGATAAAQDTRGGAQAEQEAQASTDAPPVPRPPLSPLPVPSPHDPSADPSAAHTRPCETVGPSPLYPPCLVPAHTLHDLMVIRALHSSLLRLPHHSLGTALGMRTREGQLTSLPAIIVFVSYKVHRLWVPDSQMLPRQLVGPTGVVCDVDVVEFCYTDAPAAATYAAQASPPSSSTPSPPLSTADPHGGIDIAVTAAAALDAGTGTGAGLADPEPSRERAWSAREGVGGAGGGYRRAGRSTRAAAAAVVEEMKGAAGDVGPGSQVASEGTYGTLTAVVVSTRGERAVGVLTNRHVAVDFNQPRQALHHPLPPSRGPGVLLGLVERAASFTSDSAWYGTFATPNTEAYVRVDAAFVPLHRSLDTSIITPELRGLGAMGQPCAVSLHDAIGSLINRPVCKIGATSGVTHGRIMGYAVEYNDNRSRTLFTDFLILGEQGQPFDQEGDSGSLILAMPNREGDSTDGRDHTDGDNVLRPIGVIWGGTANRGRLKLRRGHVPENWTSAVDVGRLLRLLDLRMITTSEELRALLEHPGVQDFSMQRTT